MYTWKRKWLESKIRRAGRKKRALRLGDRSAQGADELDRRAAEDAYGRLMDLRPESRRQPREEAQGDLFA